MNVACATDAMLPDVFALRRMRMKGNVGCYAVISEARMLDMLCDALPDKFYRVSHGNFSGSLCRTIMTSVGPPYTV